MNQKVKKAVGRPESEDPKEWFSIGVEKSKIKEHGKKLIKEKIKKFCDDNFEEK
jgi:hypothetical protein